MALNVIGESGVRIRPVTSGFVPELQAYIDSTAGRVGAQIPLTIESVQLQAAIDDLKSSAAGGAVLPLEVARKGVDNALVDIRKTAEAGADFALKAQGGALEQTISDAKSSVERGATMPLQASDVDLNVSIDAARASAERGADMPLYPGDVAVEAALGALRGSAQAGASFPLIPDTDQATEAFNRLRAGIENSGLSLPIDSSGAVAGIGQAQDATDQFSNQFSGALSGIQNQIDGLGVGVGGLGRKLVGLLSSPGGALLGGGAIAGAFAGANVLSAGNQRLTRIEDSTAALEIQLGGAKQAADLVADILKTVNGTPFTLDQFVEAGRTLVTFGTEASKIPTYLTAIGEAAAGSGQGIEAVGTITDVFAKMQIAGRVTTDDWQRLGYVGVNALKIWGNASGKTTAEMQKLVTDGAVPAGEAIDQLIAGITNGSDGVAGKVNKLGGSMEKLRNTFSGAAGGLSAASARFGVALLEPFRDSTVKLIQNATSALDAMAPVVRSVLTEVSQSEGLQNFIKSVGDLPSKITPVVKVLGDLAVQGVKAGEIIAAGVAPVAKVFGGAVLASLAGFVKLLTNLFGLMERNQGVTEALAGTVAAIFIASKVTSWANALFTAIRRTTTFAVVQNTARAAMAGTNAELLQQIALENQLAIVEGRRSAAQAGSTVTSAVQAASSGVAVGDVVGTAADAQGVLSAVEGVAPATRAAGAAAEEASGKFRKLFTGIRNAGSTAFESIFQLIGGWTGVITLAVVAAGLLIKTFYDQWKKQQEEVAKRRTEPLVDIRKDAESFGARIQNQKKFNADYAKLIEENRPGQDPSMKIQGTAGFVAGLTGVPGADIIGAATKNIPLLDTLSGALDLATNRTIALNEAGTNKATTAAARAELRQQTAGYGRLATAIRSATGEFEQLGLKRETDTKKVEENRKVLEEALTNRIDPALQGQERADAIAGAVRDANTLAIYSTESLTAVQDKLGLSMEEIASMSAPQLAEAVRDAAAATAEGIAASVGLGTSMATMATAFDEAKKAAEAYVGIAFAQQNSWLQGQVAADNYQQALAKLQYSTDFTASNLQGVSQAMQAQVSSAYEAASAHAQLSGSTDVTGDAAKAAAAEEAKLRDSFIESAIGAGKTRAEAENLADAIIGIPGSKTISLMIDVNSKELEDAQKKLDKLIADQKSNPWLFGGIAVAGATGTVKRLQQQQQELAFYQGILNSGNADAQKAAQDQINSTAQKEAADQARADAAAAAEQAKRDAEQAAEEAKRAAEEAAREAERLAEEARRKQEAELQAFLQMVDGIRQASEQMKSSFEKLIDTFRQKRQELIGDITKKVEFDPSTSVTRLIKNADQRNKALAESQQGLSDLRKRGLSEDAIKSIGLTGQAEDAKAIRKLLKASPEELKALSSSVGKLGETATQAAYKEQGQIIGREIRDVLEAWTETPGVRNPNVSVEQILKIIRDSKGNSEVAASRLAQQLGGVVKR